MSGNVVQRWLAAASALLGMALAYGLAEGNYTAAVFVAGILTLMAVGRISSARAETWPLALILIGYILGNRSFAQLSLTSGIPLLPAEAALACGLVVLVYRGARSQVKGIATEPVAFAVVAWIALGSARIWPDFQRYGFMAVRDYAVVYYGLFFFLARALASHPPSLRLMKRAVIGALALLPAAFLTLSHHRAGYWIPEGMLIFYKEDIVAALLVAGVFISFVRLEGSPWLQTAAVAALQAVLVGIQSSRAAVVALGLSSVWWCIARRWAYVRVQTIILTSAALLLATGALVNAGGRSSGRLEEITQRIVSITDISGRTTYENEEHGYLSDNNRFRMIWWQQVAKEVFETSPVLGLGFGYDLSRGFVRAYDQDFGENFGARSPHSILFTALGRMGLVGLIAWLAIAVSMAIATLRAIRPPGRDGLEALGWWSATWALMVSSCFGVVLEGPMGAVLFWTLLGIAVREGPANPPPAA